MTLADRNVPLGNRVSHLAAVCTSTEITLRILPVNLFDNSVRWKHRQPSCKANSCSKLVGNNLFCVSRRSSLQTVDSNVESVVFQTTRYFYLTPCLVLSRRFRIEFDKHKGFPDQTKSRILLLLVNYWRLHRESLCIRVKFGSVKYIKYPTCFLQYSLTITTCSIFPITSTEIRICTEAICATNEKKTFTHQKFVVHGLDNDLLGRVLRHVEPELQHLVVAFVLDERAVESVQPGRVMLRAQRTAVLRALCGRAERCNKPINRGGSNLLRVS